MPCSGFLGNFFSNYSGGLLPEIKEGIFPFLFRSASSFSQRFIFFAALHLFHRTFRLIILIYDRCFLIMNEMAVFGRLRRNQWIISRIITARTGAVQAADPETTGTIPCS
jgi:hypothetical protein